MRIDCDCGKVLLATQVAAPLQPQVAGPREIAVHVVMKTGANQPWVLACQQCGRIAMMVVREEDAATVLQLPPPPHPTYLKPVP